MRSDYSGKKVLVVDDESEIREFLRWEFEDRKADVIDGGSLEEGFELFKQHDPDFSLLDIRMPNGTGMDLLKSCKEMRPHSPIALMTGYTEISVSQIYAKGACDIFVKPLKYLHLFPRVDKELAPVEEKLKFQLPSGKYPEIDFAETFQELVAQNRFHMGRGGFSFQISSSEPGEVFQLTQINMSHDQWIIVKICWIEKGLKATTSLGVELIQVSQGLQEPIKEIIQSVKTPAYIPCIDAPKLNRSLRSANCRFRGS